MFLCVFWNRGLTNVCKIKMKIYITFLKVHNNRKKAAFQLQQTFRQNFKERNIDLFYLFVFQFHFHSVSTLKADSFSVTHSLTMKCL